MAIYFVREYASAMPRPLFLFAVTIISMEQIFHFSTDYDASLTFRLCWDDFVGRNFIRALKIIIGVTDPSAPHTFSLFETWQNE